jgi:branched-chain amino acid transport system ATP-binding protein
MSDILELDGMTRHYGALRALDGVSFNVQPGARHAVIGPNGAGKSTLFKLVSGAIPATGGRMRFAGEDITRTSQVARARRGIAQTFQHSSVFLRVSAGENVALAAQRALGRCRNGWRSTKRYRDVSDRVDECLSMVGLDHRRDAVAHDLSHGERQQLEVAIALATKPTMLLLDEPTAGMSAGETLRFTKLIASLPTEITILVIEHDLKVVFALATEVSVLHLGELLASGSPEEIRANPQVQSAYLGDTSMASLLEAQ